MTNRLSRVRIKTFEAEQKQHGTATALHNVIWEIASTIFRSIGATRISTSRGRRLKRNIKKEQI